MTEPKFPIDAIVTMYCSIPPDPDTDPSVAMTRPSILHVALRDSDKVDVLAYLPEDVPAPEAAALVLIDMVGLPEVEEFLVITEMWLTEHHLEEGEEPSPELTDSYHPAEMAKDGDPRVRNGVVALSARRGHEPEVRIARETVEDNGSASWETLNGSLEMLGGPLRRLATLL